MRELSYRGLVLRADYDEDDAVYFGTIEGLGTGVGVHAETVGKLEIAFHRAVDDHLDLRAEGQGAGLKPGDPSPIPAGER